jgi:hypothetical protein
MGITYWPLKVRIRVERRLDTRKGTTTPETLSVVTIAASARFEGSPLARGTDSVNPAGGSAPTTNDCVAIRRGPVRRDGPQDNVVTSTWIVDRFDDLHPFHRFSGTTDV